MKLTGRRCQCPACGEYFNSSAGFDKHRIGPFSDRDCLSKGEMRGIGMSKNSAGFWISARRINVVYSQ